MPTTRTGGAARSSDSTKSDGEAKPTSTRSAAKRTSTRTAANGAKSPSRKGGRLVIVESPAKARTISRYLGSGYTVKASMGHVRDLPKSTLGVEVDHDFEPKYLVPRDKSKLVKELKESVQNASEIILATDPDREGEAIAWHLLQATGAGDKQVHRVVFHEITPEAVREAMEHPRDIDVDLVDAYQARRILDRLVGYGVSPLLWKKVKRGLSAGRVQTAGQRLVVEREKEIQAFVAEEYWSLDAHLGRQVANRKPKDELTAALWRIRGQKASLKTGEETHTIVNDLDGALYRVAAVTARESQRRPSAPFTTSTLQQEASRKLGYPLRRTMQIAQELYEGVDLGNEGTQGLITYMRTDSTNIASSAQQAAREVIEAKYGSDSVPPKPPVYTRKSKGAQEAHEAIRPTGPHRDPASVKAFLSPQQLKVYTLVWQRFIASQMAPAILDGTTVDIDAGPAAMINAGMDTDYRFRATGSVVRFPGFLAVYRDGRDEGDEDELDKGALPKLETGEMLVKALEEQGIGRPSTYAPTIGTLQARGYVAVEQKKLVPTELGMLVNDLLVEHFPAIFDLGFTSRMEDELDEIAAGERAWVPTLHEFYGPFTQSLKTAESTMERVKLKDEPSGELCEKCERPMVIKLGRYGKFLACSGFPECRNSRPLLERIGVECPKCHQGQVVERRSKKGRTFYGCERYPECDFTAWAKPVNQTCPNCGSFMVEAGRKGQIRCPSCRPTGEASPAA